MADYGKAGLMALVLACGIIVGFGIFAALCPVSPLHPTKQIVLTDAAPKPIGPYSQAVQSGEFLFISGQIGLDPRTGNLSPTVEGQTAQIMDNLNAVLSAEGLGFPDVVQTRIYLTNLSDWDAVNGIYGKPFTGQYPARATIEVSGLPKGAKVEIEMIAVRHSYG